MAKRKIMSINQLLEKNYVTYAFTGVYKDLVGEPERNFRMIIAGKRKQGKTTLCSGFAKYLADNFGKVLYVSYEQGNAKTTQDVFARAYESSKPKNIFLGYKLSFEELKTKIKRNHYRFIFIDSIQWSNFSKKQYIELVEEFPRKSFILISHTLSSDFFAHAVDVITTVSEGLAISESRYGATVPYQIPYVYDQFQKQKRKTVPGQYTLGI